MPLQNVTATTPVTKRAGALLVELGKSVHQLNDDAGRKFEDALSRCSRDATQCEFMYGDSSIPLQTAFENWKDGRYKNFKSIKDLDKSTPVTKRALEIWSELGRYGRLSDRGRLFESALVTCGNDSSECRFMDDAMKIPDNDIGQAFDAAFESWKGTTSNETMTKDDLGKATPVTERADALQGELFNFAQQLSDDGRAFESALSQCANDPNKCAFMNDDPSISFDAAFESWKQQNKLTITKNDLNKATPETLRAREIWEELTDFAEGALTDLGQQFQTALISCTDDRAKCESIVPNTMTTLQDAFDLWRGNMVVVYDQNGANGAKVQEIGDTLNEDTHILLGDLPVNSAGNVELDMELDMIEHAENAPPPISATKRRNVRDNTNARMKALNARIAMAKNVVPLMQGNLHEILRRSTYNASQISDIINGAIIRSGGSSTIDANWVSTEISKSIQPTPSSTFATRFELPPLDNTYYYVRVTRTAQSSVAQSSVANQPGSTYVTLNGKEHFHVMFIKRVEQPASMNSRNTVPRNTNFASKRRVALSPAPLTFATIYDIFLDAIATRRRDESSEQITYDWIKSLVDTKIWPHANTINLEGSFQSVPPTHVLTISKIRKISTNINTPASTLVMQVDETWYKISFSGSTRAQTPLLSDPKARHAFPTASQLASAINNYAMDPGVSNTINSVTADTATPITEDAILDILHRKFGKQFLFTARCPYSWGAYTTATHRVTATAITNNNCTDSNGTTAMIVEATAVTDNTVTDNTKYYQLSFDPLGNANELPPNAYIEGGANKRVVPLTKRSLVELKLSAASLGVKGRSKMNKDELLCAIRKHKRSSKTA